MITLSATLINAGAILAGGALGLLLRGGIPKRVSEIIMRALALSVLLIGLKNALSGDDVFVCIVSLVAGGVLGELLNIEDRLAGLGDAIKRRLPEGGGARFTEGFVSASLLYCVGAMAIVGSLSAGLRGDYSILYAKSILDGVSAVMFASAMGPGVLFSAAAVLVYQGAITLLAGVLSPLLTDAVVTAMSSTGGLLIAAIALNMLDIPSFRIKVGNLLPAVFVPIAYLYIYALITG